MKERLLGAAVLIAAAVLIIPAFLDGPRPPETVSQELQLPVAQDASEYAGDGSRTHTVQIEAVPARSGGAGVDFATQPEFVPSATTPPVSLPAPRSPDTVAKATPEPAKEAARTSTPDSEPKINTAPASAGWAVQVGSFSSETNARRLMEYLKGSGYPAFVTRNVVNGRVMFRVRVGPEADKPRAEALAERLKDDRQQTQLVRHP